MSFAGDAKGRVSIVGVEEICRRLQGLPQRIRENAIRAALRKGMKVVQAEARRRVRVKTGALRQALEIRISTTREGAIGRLGPKKDKEFLVKRVTSKMSPTKKNSRGNAVREKDYSTGVVKLKNGHYLRTDMELKKPSAYAKRVELKSPFLRPTREVTEDDVMRIFGEEVQKEVAKRMAPGYKNGNLGVFRPRKSK